VLVGYLLCEETDFLLAIRRTFIAQLTRVSAQTISKFPLSFRKVRRDDLISDGQSRQRGPSPLLGDFTCTPYLTGEEGTGVRMKRGVGHVS
jgi:hypothetical protein